MIEWVHGVSHFKDFVLITCILKLKKRVLTSLLLNRENFSSQHLRTKKGFTLVISDPLDISNICYTSERYRYVRNVIF